MEINRVLLNILTSKYSDRRQHINSILSIHLKIAIDDRNLVWNYTNAVFTFDLSVAINLILDKPNFVTTFGHSCFNLKLKIYRNGDSHIKNVRYWNYLYLFSTTEIKFCFNFLILSELNYKYRYFWSKTMSY